MVSLKFASPQKQQPGTRRLVLRFWEISSLSSTRGPGRTFQEESLSERLFARRGEVDHARSVRASRPAELEASIEQGSAQRAGKVVTAHTPIQTGATQRATSAHQRFNVDPDPGKESLSAAGELQPIAAGSQQVPLLEAVEDEHTQFAGKVVVAHSGLSKRRLSRTRAKTHRAGSIGHTHEALEKLCDVAIVETKISVPSLVFHGDQSRFEQLGEVSADRLFGHPGDTRELGGGQCLARGERRQDFRPGVVAYQGRDADDVRAVFHGSILVEPFQCRKVLSSQLIKASKRTERT